MVHAGHPKACWGFRGEGMWEFSSERSCRSKEMGAGKRLLTLKRGGDVKMLP